ncbi:GPP34 family phosphoprotein [Microbacterium sp.]|uniref:GOLPH3/VPS74 family protein n=1 Tax=Microbacterium sp. TaxID=51671 RepID=UPI0027339D45|nr:GPP34 family phosphoprotein [Microbacterium sp.]MDP3949321.1 GPP34 family phosphoprotein [Microbacterium sp.]
MTDDSIHSQRTRTLITEDLLLVLFQPDSGTIAGENTLFYVLAAGALTDLAQHGHATIADAGFRGTLIHAAGEPPEDELLRPMWDYISQKPRGVQTVLAASGPTLREPVLDRLVERGHLCRQKRRVLGLFPSTSLVDGGSGRRSELVAEMRAVLVDAAVPSEHIAALTALVSASGSLPVLHREIPWSGTTATRAKNLEQGDWAAGTAATAVTRTMIAVVANSLIAGAVVANR